MLAALAPDMEWLMEHSFTERNTITPDRGAKEVEEILSRCQRASILLERRYCWDSFILKRALNAALMLIPVGCSLDIEYRYERRAEGVAAFAQLRLALVKAMVEKYFFWNPSKCHPVGTC